MIRLSATQRAAYLQYTSIFQYVGLGGVTPLK